MERSKLGDWLPLLQSELEKPYFSALSEKVSLAYKTSTVYPPEEDLFAAFSLTPPDWVKAVILGQDPYHGPGQAHGLSFSVRPGVPLPPSLSNIYKEYRDDLCLPAPRDGCLIPWAKQGVLLLNSTLTVEDGKAGSHQRFGWQSFTDAVISACNALPQPICFVLWGGHAQKKAALLQDAPAPRLLLQAPHPSPLSSYRGFFGSRPFSKINAFLEENGVPPIDWTL